MSENHLFSKPRRRILRLTGLTSVAAMAPAHAKGLKTPDAAEGPYYPDPSMRYDDIDNDLVKIAEKTQRAGGEIFTLKGIITDTELTPLAGIRVEIWQCDVNGRYLHTSDRNSATMDSGFQGFGHTVTNDAGEYTFRTIKPVSYPGRTPHIHVKLFREENVLTTQFYLKNHPENSRDSLYRRLSAEEKQAVEMDIATHDGVTEAVVNVIC